MLAGIIITVFGVIGAASVIKWIVVKIMATGKTSERIYGVILKGENADIELQMAIETLDWNGGLNAGTFAVDCGIDNGCYAICKDLCARSRFRLVTPEQLCKLLNENNL